MIREIIKTVNEEMAKEERRAFLLLNK